MCLARQPPSPARAHLSPLNHYLYLIADISYEATINDTQKLVRVQVRAQINPILQDRFHLQHAFAVQRQAGLNRWLDSPLPLAYGDGQATFISLIHAISDNHTMVANGFPPSHRTDWSLATFIDNIYHQGLYSTSSHYRAPIVPKGALGPTLRVSIAHVRGMNPDVPHEDADRDFKAALLAVFSEKRVAFIPDGRINPNGRGAPSREPSIASWTRLAAPDPRHDFLPAMYTSQEARNEAALVRLAQQHVLEDVRGAWDTRTIRIDQFHHYLTRVRMPDNFDPSAAIRDEKIPITLETYNWACEKFRTSLSEPFPQLALILAFLLSKALPTVGWDKTFPRFQRNKFKASDPKGSIKTMRSLVKWEKKLDGNGKLRKGTGNESLFFSCAAIVFLAWMDASSPLRSNLNTPHFLTDWNRKHG